MEIMNTDSAREAPAMTKAEALAIEQRSRYVAGLRAAADFYERHTEIVVPNADDNRITNYRVDSKDEARAVIQALGSCTKHYDDYNFTISKEITPGFMLRFVFLRDQVCEKVQVGTKTVPEHIIPAEPAREEKLVPQREEPIYEYRCPSILAGGGRSELEDRDG